MIVKANKTLKHKDLHKKGEVFKVNDLAGKQLIEAGLATEVKQGYKDRQTKPAGGKVTYKVAGPYVQKFVDGEKVESKYKSDAKAEWGWDG